MILLERLAYFDVRRVILCTGYLGDLIENALGNTFGPIGLTYSRELRPLDTAGAIANARHLLPPGPLLIMNGDSYCHTDLNRFYDWFQSGTASVGLLLTRATDTARYGRVEIDSSGQIIAFREKSHQNGPGLINAGIYIIDKAVIETVPESVPCSLEKEIFPGLADGRLAGFPTRDAFIDIGTGEDYNKAAAFFATLDGQI